MMAMKLVVMYASPADPAAFDEHYFGVHGPLVDQIPGLVRWESARVAAAADGGERSYYRIVELYFQDKEALNAGLASDEGRATAEDFQQIAPPGSRMFIAAVED